LVLEQEAKKNPSKEMNSKYLNAIIVSNLRRFNTLVVQIQTGMIGF